MAIRPSPIIILQIITMVWVSKEPHNYIGLGTKSNIIMAICKIIYLQMPQRNYGHQTKFNINIGSSPIIILQRITMAWASKEPHNYIELGKIIIGPSQIVMMAIYKIVKVLLGQKMYGFHQGCSQRSHYLQGLMS